MINFEKGNVPLSAHKTEAPVEQKNINPEIWEVIQKESGDEKLGENNNIEFLIMKDDESGEYSAKFIKITKEDGQIVEFKASEKLCGLIVSQSIDQSNQN